nr:MAG: hypothetical protein [Microvirus sp.]
MSDDNVDVDGIQVRAMLDDRGRELGDPVPMAPPVGLTRSPSLAEQIRSMVRREMSDAAANHGMETFEEADDFDIDDDPLDPHTPYEAVFDPQPELTKEEKEDKSSDVKTEEKKDGSSKSVDKGRNADRDGRSGRSGKKRESVSKSSGNADDERDVHETDNDNSDGEE